MLLVLFNAFIIACFIGSIFQSRAQPNSFLKGFIHVMFVITLTILFLDEACDSKMFKKRVSKLEYAAEIEQDSTLLRSVRNLSS